MEIKMASEKSKVLLVYSGGLDTSICIPLMRQEYGYQDVVTVTVDVGQPQADIDMAAEKAKILGTEHYTVDAKEEFAKNFCFTSLQANGDYQGYPMSTSIARPLIAAKAVEVAKKLGITSFAHGCTGKGNDQYRIEFGIRSLMANATIHAPVRERNMTRSWEIEYAQKNRWKLYISFHYNWWREKNILKYKKLFNTSALNSIKVDNKNITGNELIYYIINNPFCSVYFEF
jgi:argininosuccinate synthase